jgi:polyribonucleotide nucleotidyltransferase
MQSGPESAVEAAVEMLQEAVEKLRTTRTEQFTPHTEARRFEFPPELIGGLIGVGGARVKSLTEASGVARIDIRKSEPGVAYIVRPPLL